MKVRGAGLFSLGLKFTGEKLHFQCLYYDVLIRTQNMVYTRSRWFFLWKTGHFGGEFSLGGGEGELQEWVVDESILRNYVHGTISFHRYRTTTINVC